MNDRGEKIVRLAREMLEEEFPRHERPAKPDTGKKQISLKTMLLTLILTAFGSGTATHIFDEMRRPINRYERVELEALLFYLARETARDEDTVRREIAELYFPSGLDNISVRDFLRARSHMLAQLR